MDRRRFLESLILGASALAIDPERLLWTPGAKTIFIPPPLRVVRYVEERWVRLRSGRIRIDLVNFETDELLETRNWPDDQRPFVWIPQYRLPAPNTVVRREFRLSDCD